MSKKKRRGKQCHFGKTPKITLSIPKMHILNCFGMQPVFVKDGKIDESFMGFVYRVGAVTNFTGKMHQLHKWRLGDENQVILDNAFHIKDADKHVVNTLLDGRTFAFKQNGNLDELMKPENFPKLKDILLMHMKRIKYYTMMCQGNFMITSRRDLYNAKLFNLTEVRCFMPYLVSEDILPRNMVILGHSDHNSFRTPYVACPLFDKRKFDELCKMNGIDLKELTKIDTKKKYPLIDKQVSLYSLYQSYLDNVEVPYWYIETFCDPVKTRQKAYYTVLVFD